MTTYQYQAPTTEELAAQQTRSGSQLGATIGELGGRGIVLGAAWCGYKAAKNHYARTQDWGQAILLGALAARRWLFWYIGVALWLMYAFMELVAQRVTSSAGFHNYDTTGPSPHTTLVLNAVVLVLALVFSIGVPYTRHVDFSLFKRRLAYRLFQPVARLVDWCPTFFLYSVVPLSFFISFLYSLSTTQPV